MNTELPSRGRWILQVALFIAGALWGAYLLVAALAIGEFGSASSTLIVWVAALGAAMLALSPVAWFLARRTRSARWPVGYLGICVVLTAAVIVTLAAI